MNAQSNVKTQPRIKTPFNGRISLGVKLPLIVLFLLALAFTISTYLNVRATQNALVETLRVELNAQTALQAKIIRLQLTAARNTAIDLAVSAEVNRYDEKTIRNAIKNTLERNEQVFGSTIAYEPYQFRSDLYYWSPYYSRTTDGSGNLQFAQLGTPEYDYFKWDWYALPKQRGAPVLSPPYFDEGGGNIWMVTWSVPFFDGSSKFKGVATADIAFSQTQEIISSIAVGQNGYAFLIDSQGVVLGIGDKGGLYQPMKDSMLVIAQTAEATEWEALVKGMTQNKTGFVSATDPQGLPVFVAYTPIGLDTGWSLGLAFPQGDLTAKTAQTQNALVGYAIAVAVIFGTIIYLVTLPITQPLRQLTLRVQELSTNKVQLAEGKLLNPIRLNTRDELEELAEAFNQMAENVALAFELMEEKVIDHTARIERSTLEFSIVAEIARDITIIRDLDTLLNVSANLIRERFNYYHVGVFLLDDHGEYAVLRAASSHAAQQMLDQNYRLRTGQGLVGNVIRTGQAHIALDVGKDAVHFQNPFLPDTHSEIALPLHSHSVTIGALDIQTTVESAFDERDLKTLQLLADLLAAAIENAELAEQVKQTLTELNVAYRSQSQRMWLADVEQHERPAYEYDGLQVRQIPARLPGDLLKRLESGKPIIFKETDPRLNAEKKTLLAPIMVLDQVIGVISLEQESPDQVWTEDDIAMVQAAANRAALTLENARLLEESQRRAVKERAIFEAAARIGAALDVENILYATVEEIERVTNSAEVTLQFMNNKKK